jgi:hypothetical protein
VAATWLAAACSGGNDAPSLDGGVSSVGDAGSQAPTTTTTDARAAEPEGGNDAGADAADPDAEGGAADGSVDAALDAGADAATPAAVVFSGRFETTDPLGPKTAWPGARIAATFDGTDVSVTLTQTNGFSGGPAYFNTVIDGAVTNVVSVAGTQTLTLASGLAPGPHTVELEKRTEAPFGTVRFEGFTFAGGAGLLPPPPRPTRRIEVLADSTIDGYGVDGDRFVTCPGGTAPPQFNDARKGTAWRTATGLSAELNLIGYSGKGLARNAGGSTVDTFPVVYARTLPDVPGAWNFASFVPDVVVISVGGADYGGDPNGTFPASFTASYAQLVADIRARYGAGPHVLLAVWSQHKSYNGVRQAILGAIDAVTAGRPAGEKTTKFVFPEADPSVETGCQYHANSQHHADMAALLIQEIKTKTGWP